MRRALDKFRTLLLVLVLAITSLGMTRPAAAMLSLPLEEIDNGCTYYIPIEVSVVDGRDNYQHVKPGDVLCIPAGERGNLKLMYLQGEPGKPITVRNAGGIVTISGEKFLSGGIGIYASSFLRVTGSGDASQCGAPYSTAEQKCGIAITNTRKGIKINTTKDVESLHDLEIDHISISDTSKTIKTRGIAIHPGEGQLISGLYIHHNYVARTLAEAIYMGTEPHDRPFEVLGKIQNLEVSYNRIEQIGFDGIKVKVAVKNVRVHHNVIHDVGLSDTPNHRSGILSATSTGQFYNNYMKNVFDGIRSSRPLDGMTESRYFNNVVVNARNVSIEAAEEGALIFNNTVIYCGEGGIIARAASSQVLDNIVAGCNGKEIKTKPGPDNTRQNFKNLVGFIESMGFVDPANGNYQLRPDSIAIDAGQIQPDLLPYDYDDVPRPQGKGSDIGAFEYRAESGRSLEYLEYSVWLSSERGP